MNQRDEKVWKHATTGTNGNVILFDVRIFDYKWQRTSESVQIRDPLYGQPYTFPIYTAVIREKTYTFAAGEFSNCVWGFYIPTDGNRF